MGLPTVCDLSSCVRQFEENVVLRRSLPVIFNLTTGRYDQPTPRESDRTIKATIYPTTPREAQILPEGVRNKQLLTLFTQDQLKAASSRNRKDGDIILYREDEYEVQRTEDWQNTGSYFKSISVRVAPDGLL